MSKVESIEKEIERLDDESFATFRAWFIEYEHERWDRQLEADSAAGKLDSLIDEALADHQSGKAAPF